MNNSTNPLSNGTNNRTMFGHAPSQKFTDMEWAFGIFLTHTLCAVFIITGNMFVLVAFAKNARLRTTTNIVIMSMALSDLLVGVFVLPSWMYISYTSFRPSGPTPPSFRIFVQAYQKIDQTLPLVSVYHLVYLHSLRCYSIVFPLRHRQMSNRPVILAIILIWSISIAFPPVVRDVLNCAMKCFVFVVLVVNIGLPLVIMSIANIILYKTVIRSNRQHQSRDTKILVTVAILLGLLAACYLPFVIVNVYLMFHQVTVPTIIIVKFLHFLNSGVNPVVYALRNPDLGRTIRALACGKSQRDVTSVGRTVTTSQPRRSVRITTT